ncbi:hypothetical protein PT110_09525, partial [Erysipelothrix rhusiopathiae]|nr:hypothetical protein [Erysipelothrix rhusiopathiae]
MKKVYGIIMVMLSLVLVGCGTNPQPYQEEIYHLLHELDIPYREDHHKPIFTVESDDLDIPGPQVK